MVGAVALQGGHLIASQVVFVVFWPHSAGLHRIKSRLRADLRSGLVWVGVIFACLGSHEGRRCCLWLTGESLQVLALVNGIIRTGPVSSRFGTVSPTGPPNAFHSRLSRRFLVTR